MEDRASKIEKFIQDREELKKSPVKVKERGSVFKDKNPKIKSLPNQPKPLKTTIKSSTPKIDTKEVTKLTPERFKAVQEKLKAKSVVKGKLSQALKKGDIKAVKGIVEQVGDVAKKTGKTDLLADLVKRVSKSKFAKQGVKKIIGAIPLVGGVASALSSGDIKAAVPGLDYIDDLGPKKGSLNHRIETGQLTAEDIKMLKEKNAR